MTNKEAAEKLKEILFMTGYKEALDVAIKALEERPTGEWIIHPHSMIMQCSLCGNEETAKNIGIVDSDKHFCSNCGAKMKEAESEQV